MGAGEERILAAAADPEGLQLAVGAGGIFEQSVEARFEIGGDGAGEGRDGAEEIEMTEADAEGLAAAHGEAGNGAILTPRSDAVPGFNGRDHVLQHIVFKERVVVGCAERRGMAPRHNDDHGYELLFGEEVIEDEIRAAGGGPTGGRVVGAVEEVQHGVAAGALR